MCSYCRMCCNLTVWHFDPMFQNLDKIIFQKLNFDMYADYNYRPIFELVLSNRTWCCKITMILWFRADLITVSIRWIQFRHIFGSYHTTEYIPSLKIGNWIIFKVYLKGKLLSNFLFGSWKRNFVWKILVTNFLIVFCTTTKSQMRI